MRALPRFAWNDVLKRFGGRDHAASGEVFMEEAAWGYVR